MDRELNRNNYELRSMRPTEPPTYGNVEGMGGYEALPGRASTSATGKELQDLDTRTKRKLDFVLLPFLALLFLFNSLDKSNVRHSTVMKRILALSLAVPFVLQSFPFCLFLPQS